MADKIQVDREKVENDVRQIEDVASYLAEIPLDSQDARTTIPANANSKAAYARSQQRISGLGVMLDQEVRNIRGLNVAFQEFDEMMGQLAENGGRGSFITEGKE